MNPLVPVALLGVAALGWFWSRSRQPPPRRKKSSTSTEPDPSDTGGGGGGGGTANWVGGSSSYSWPEKGRFPNEQSFVQWLSSRGYSASGNSVRSTGNINAVKLFQDDYNAVVAATPMSIAPNSLLTDGKIGNNTVRAMANVDVTLLPFYGTSWQQAVGQARTSGL